MTIPTVLGQDIKISIIVPVYNISKYLSECLESILNQTYKNYEVIVVDDKSTDNSLEIISNFVRRDNRIKLYRLNENLGPGPARNYGIKQVAGEYCLFCDADDTYPSYALQVLVEAAKRNCSSIVVGNIAIMDEHLSYYIPLDNTLTTLQIRQEKTVFNLQSPELWLPYHHPKYLISKNLIVNNRISYPGLRRGQDPVFMAQCLCAAKSITMIPHTVYNYRTYKTLKQAIPNDSVFLEHLAHYEWTSKIYINSGNIHCACHYYIQAFHTYLSYHLWRRLTENTKKQLYNKFLKYSQLMHHYKPWDRSYQPYDIDLEHFHKLEQYYLKSPMLAFMYNTTSKIIKKGKKFFLG